MVQFNSEGRYFNFPIQLLEGFLEDKYTVLKNIMDYSIYSLSRELEYGDEIEKFSDQAKFFNISIQNIEQSFFNGLDLSNLYQGVSPMSGIKVAVWEDFYFNEKTEFIMVSLLGHLALKSIIGEKPYCKLTNEYWFSRMCGKRNTKEEIDPSSAIMKYSTAYYLSKVKNELEDWWNLKHYGKTRGFFVSYKMSFEELVFQVEAHRKMNQSMEKNRRKKSIVAEVIKKVNS